MENNNNRSRRSSASEKAKEIEAINGLVSGKNVLITGGASGLGYAFMNHFLKHGANKVAILDIDADAGRKVEITVEKSYGEKKVHFIHADVSNYQQLSEAFEEAIKLMNDIDVVINNAGILDERRWEKEIAVNIGGMVSTALLAMKYLNRNELGHGGTLVNVSQHIDIRCTAQLPVYTATKHAIIGLSQSLALLTCLGVTAGGISALIYALDRSVTASELIAHPPNYKWDFYGFFNSLDHKSMRRGWEVYKNVCSACHSLQYVAYRELVGVTHTEDEAKALAEEIQVQDGPDDTGAYFMRPGKLSDYIPPPYPNEEAARAANNGAYPPDLTFIVNARHNGENYVFSLLTGYCDAPAGIQVGEGQSFNPYFPGGAIGMAQVIFDEVVDFEDGTPATASQIAKDITTFLMWTSNPEFDERKRLAIKAIIIFSTLTALTVYWKKQKWTTIKNTKLLYTPRKQ